MTVLNRLLNTPYCTYFVRLQECRRTNKPSPITKTTETHCNTVNAAQSLTPKANMHKIQVQAPPSQIALSGGSVPRKHSPQLILDTYE